jgi:hypothetical protein
VSCADGPGPPRGFCLCYGFADTGRVIWGENLLVLDLALCGRPGDRPVTSARVDLRTSRTSAP